MVLGLVLPVVVVVHSRGTFYVESKGIDAGMTGIGFTPGNSGRLPAVMS